MKRALGLLIGGLALGMAVAQAGPGVNVWISTGGAGPSRPCPPVYRPVCPPVHRPVCIYPVWNGWGPGVIPGWTYYAGGPLTYSAPEIIVSSGSSRGVSRGTVSNLPVRVPPPVTPPPENNPFRWRR